MITKAIILIAGMGTRLRPRTMRVHKCMTKVNGKPILLNALDRLNDIGVQEVVLVIGYLGEDIKKEVGNGYKRIKIKYAKNEKYSETNTSFSLKKGIGAVKDYDCLYILEGDVFFSDELLDKINKDDHMNATLLEPYESRLDGTFVTLGDDRFVKEWTHKSMRYKGYIVENKYKTINIHRFSADFISSYLYPNLISVCERSKGREPLENVMRIIVEENNTSIYGVLSEGSRWFEIDDENDLKIAERIFS